MSKVEKEDPNWYKNYRRKEATSKNKEMTDRKESLIKTADIALNRLNANEVNIGAHVEDVPYKHATHILDYYKDTYRCASKALNDMKKYLEEAE